MIEIAVVSGKGGTGKTSLTASFAYLSAGRAVLADCDVDAPNLGLITDPTTRETHEFWGSREPVIDREKCSGCSLCARACRFGGMGEDLEVNSLACEGCGVCSWICPEGAITMREALSGRWLVSDTPHGTLVHARLEPGEENSGKLVTLVRETALSEARTQDRDLVLIDGPAGIGCPVIASLTGVSCALVVTEPTLAGIHDLDRILNLCHHFGVPAQVCINRYDLHAGNARAIQERLRDQGVGILGTIPYDRAVAETMVQGLPVASREGEASSSIRTVWEGLLKFALDCSKRPRH